MAPIVMSVQPRGCMAPIVNFRSALSLPISLVRG
jgi:hypothetical protein